VFYTEVILLMKNIRSSYALALFEIITSRQIETPRLNYFVMILSAALILFDIEVCSCGQTIYSSRSASLYSYSKKIMF
jgi:hypothetical protein